MKVTAHYSNGTTRDVTQYVIWPKDPLTAEDTEFTVTFPYAMYRDENGKAGQEAEQPFAVLTLTVGETAAAKKGDVNGDGEIDSLDGLLLMRYLNGWDVEIACPDAMDVNGDGETDSLDGLLLMRFLNGWDVTLE